MTQLSDEVVERVARALFMQEWQEFVPEGQWNADREYWREAARAAIAAYEATLQP